MFAIELTLDSFEEEVLKSDKPVLVDFWSPTCGPCMMVAPIIEEIAEEEKEKKICKVNVGEEPTLAYRYKVMSIPTFLVFKNGEVVNKAIGARNKEAILDLFDFSE